MPSVKTGLPRHHQRRAAWLRDRPTAANALRHIYPSPPPPPLLPPSGSGRVTDQPRGFTTLPRLPRCVPYARYRTAPVPREGHHLIPGSDPAASYKQRSGRPRPGCPFHVSVGRHPGEARNMSITCRVMRTAFSASLVRRPRRLGRWPPVPYTGGSLPARSRDTALLRLAVSLWCCAARPGRPTPRRRRPPPPPQSRAKTFSERPFS